MSAGNPNMDSTVDDLNSEPVHSFTYKRHSVEIYANGVFTADIDGISWSLNTFKPKTLGDAVRGAKHIIDNPPRLPEEAAQ
jgi:hypothetical protein